MNSHRPVRVISRALSRALSQSSTSSAAAAEPSFSLKNVTRSNFEPVLAELRHHVAAADFVAVDLEMSGVTSAPWRDTLEFDRPDVSYLKIKDSAEKFAVLQFGVCPFRWDSSKKSFIAHPHNFYIFPRQELPVESPTYEFLCQTTSIDFLARYQFDFNSCIHEGISYLSREQESTALRRLHVAYEDGSNLKEVKEAPLVNIADTLFSERMKNTFTEWRDGLLRNRNEGSQFQGFSKDRQQHLETIFFKMRPALSLNGFTLHQLRLIQRVIRRHFQDLSYVQVNGENSCQQRLVVHTDSEDERDSLMKEVKEDHLRQTESKVQAAVGFRHVIDLLSSEKKLIVGHNCFLDIAHIYSKFVGPLPSTAEEFVFSVNQCFPHIIDTKLLLNADNLLRQRMRSQTSLSSAFASLCPQMSLMAKSTDLAFQLCVKVEVQVDDLRSSNWNSGAKHEAGYDAFMTGCVFAQACGHLGINFEACLPSEKLAHNVKLQMHVNLLFLNWMKGDFIDLTTGGKNTMPVASWKKQRFSDISFEKVALIWGFPSKLKAQEIRECISKVLGPSSIVFIYRLDETAVFVHFKKEKLVSEFLSLKDNLERNNGPVSVLHPFTVLLEGGNTRAADYETYKEICGSSSAKFLFADQAEAFGIQWKTKLVKAKASVDSLECESSGVQENALNPSSKVAEKSESKDIDNVSSDSSTVHVSHFKIIDSLIASRTDKVRTNL